MIQMIYQLPGLVEKFYSPIDHLKDNNKLEQFPYLQEIYQFLKQLDLKENSNPVILNNNSSTFGNFTSE